MRHVVRMMLIARYWAGSSSKVAPITAEQWWADFQRVHGPEPRHGGEVVGREAERAGEPGHGAVL